MASLKKAALKKKTERTKAAHEASVGHIVLQTLPRVADLERDLKKMRLQLKKQDAVMDVLKENYEAILALARQINVNQRAQQKRLDTIYRFLRLDLNDGMVVVDNVPHLEECPVAQNKVVKHIVDGKRMILKAPCTCGSQPDEKKTN